MTLDYYIFNNGYVSAHKHVAFVEITASFEKDRTKTGSIISPRSKVTMSISCEKRMAGTMMEHWRTEEMKFESQKQDFKSFSEDYSFFQLNCTSMEIE